MQKEIKMYLEDYETIMLAGKERLVFVEERDSRGKPIVVSIPTDEELLALHLAEVRMEVA